MAGVSYLSGAEYEWVIDQLAKYTTFADIKTALAHVDGTYMDGREDELSFQAYKRRAYSDVAGFAGSTEGWAQAYWNVLAPAPTAIVPASFDIAGGEEAVILGSLFPPGCTVTVGDGEAATDVEVLSLTPGAIHVRMPAMAAGTDMDIVITNPHADTEGTLADAVVYAKKTPVFTSISPASGPAAGGTVCHIVGSDFTPGMVVTIGGHACKVLSESPTAIFIRTPAHAAGALDVVVTAVNADADTGTEAFTYV